MGKPVLISIPQSECKSKFKFNSNFLVESEMNDANLHFGIFVQCIIYFIFQRQYSFTTFSSKEDLDHLQKHIITPSQSDNTLYRFQCGCLVLIL